MNGYPNFFITHSNYVKVSYCCTQNVGNINKSHNKRLINLSNHHAHPCNRRKKKRLSFGGEMKNWKHNL